MLTPITIPINLEINVSFKGDEARTTEFSTNPLLARAFSSINRQEKEHKPIKRKKIGKSSVFSPENVERIKQLVSDGESYRKISYETGFASYRIRDHIQKMRQKDPSYPKYTATRHVYTDAEREQIRSMYESGAKLAEISRSLNKTDGSVFAVITDLIKAKKMQRRPRRRQPAEITPPVIPVNV